MHGFFLWAAMLPAQVQVPSSVTMGTQAMPLVEESLQINIDGQHATSTLTQIFHNTSTTRLEGLFEFRAPPGTEVEGFSYWNGEKKIVGEVFEKSIARNVYSSVRNRRRDPGLLEQVDEGRFALRIFPIEPHERKRVQVRYARWLPQHEGGIEYRARLLRPDSLIEVQLALGENEYSGEISSPTHTLTQRKQGHFVYIRAASSAPKTEFVLRLKRSSTSWNILAHTYMNKGGAVDGYLNIALSAPQEVSAQKVPRDVTVAIDRSGSMSAQAFRRARDVAQEISDRLTQSDRMNILFFDDGVDRLFRTPELMTRSVRASIQNYLNRASIGGGTNIAKVLQTGFRAQHNDQRSKFLLLITDGRSSSKAVFAVAQADTSNTRVFTVGIGKQVSKSMLSRLALLKRGRFLFVDDAESMTSQAMRIFTRLREPLWVGAEIEVNGRPLQRAYPQTLPDIFPGDELRVSGRYDARETVRITVRGKVMGKTTIISKTVPMENEHRWVGRLWARSRVNELLEEEAQYGQSSERRSEMLDLALAYNILTPHTAFLAIPAHEAQGNARAHLLSAREQRRKLLVKYQGVVQQLNPNMLQGVVNRKSMSLSGGLPGVGVKPGVVGSGKSRAKNKLRRASGRYGTTGDVGGFGRLGRRGGSGGSGYSKGGQMDQEKSMNAPAIVQGSLDKAEIQRVINGYRSQIAQCYEDGLKQNAQLQGKVLVEWNIDAGGRVTRVRIRSTELQAPNVERCLIKRVQSWTFPKPIGGGTVTVVYPFVLQGSPQEL